MLLKFQKYQLLFAKENNEKNSEKLLEIKKKTHVVTEFLSSVRGCIMNTFPNY